MENIIFNQSIPVRHQVDVLVAGGGPAGCAAAWAAARMGKKVLLLEGHSCLGGLGTAGMVPAFMHISDGYHLLCAGFASELLHGCITVPLISNRRNQRRPQHPCRGPETDLRRTSDRSRG